MRTVALVLSCLAGAGHGRSTHTLYERIQSRSKEEPHSNDVKAFATLLQALNPSAGFQPNVPSAGWQTRTDVTRHPQIDSRRAHSIFMEQESKAPTRHSEVLIEKAKEIVYKKSGFYSNYDESVYSDDFVFRGPYIGPLNKKDYLQTMDAFKVYEAIPDINPNAWGFSIDPKDPNRVWFLVRNTGTFNGKPFAPDSINFKPNGAKLDGCPETFSILFDEEQKMKYLSVGYVADRFEGNTNGKGAAVGIFNAIGLPFPPVGPVQRFAQWFGTEVLSFGPMSYSPKDVPKWWKDETIGSAGYL